MHPKQKHIYVGVDTHKFSHTAVIIDCWGEKLGEITIDNKPAVFDLVIEEVKRHLKRGVSPIFGLEDTESVGRAFAMFLLKSKYIVKEVNSSLTNSERKNAAIFHKDDIFDSLCIARVLLSRLNELKDANPQDIYWTLNQLVMRREAMVKTCTALKNQLHVQVAHNYPSYNKFFSEIDGKTAMAFWEKYPSPAKLKDAKLEDIYELLHEKSNSFFTMEKVEKIIFTTSNDGFTEFLGYQDMRDYLVESIVRELNFKAKELKNIEKELERMVLSMDYKLQSMNGINMVTASKLIGEIGDINRFPTPHKLAKYCGVAPITFSSSKTEKQYKSHQGNRQLYGVFHLLAVHQILQDRNTKNPRNPLFRAYYEKKMQEGKTSGQAIVCIARRLVNIIWGMMKNKTEYILPELPKE